jgi:hypothetical protein
MKTEVIETTSAAKVRKSNEDTFSVVEDSQKQRIIYALYILIALSVFFASFFFRSKPLSPPVEVSKEALMQDLPFYSSAKEQVNMTKLKSGKSFKKVSPFEVPRVITRYDALEFPEMKVRAKLTSSVSKGVARANLVDELRLDGELISRSGAEVRGHVTSALPERILISFDSLEAITGDRFVITAEAVDMGDEMQGIAPSIAKKKAWNVAHLIAFNFLGGLADGLQSTTTGGRKVGGSVTNALLEGASRAATDESRNILSEAQSKEVITPISVGKEFLLQFGKKGDVYELSK